MTELDTIDRKILHRLQQSTEIALDALGQEVGLSRNACWRRIKALEKSGVIRERVAHLDPQALGLTLTVFIQIRTDRHGKAWAQAFARATRALPEIQGVYRMSGELDYLVRAQVADMAAYDRLYRRLTEEVEIADVTASFVMEAIKETTAYPVL